MASHRGDSCLAVFSDIHAGSIYGLLPPDFQTSDEKIVGMNPGQEYLWACWLDAAERASKLPISAVIFNGDAIDGKQQAQRGTELSLPLIADQSTAAEQIIRTFMSRLKGKPPLYLVAGTEYHDSRAAREIEVIGRSLGAVSYGGLGTGRYCREVLDLEVDGVVINFAHGISASGGLYRATAPDREGVWSALAGKEGRAPRADCVVRSHVHTFVHVEHATKHIVVTPCWQLQTRFMRKNSVYRMMPDIGLIFIWVHGEAKKKREDPIHIDKILYDLPSRKPTRIRASE
jgi:hypothetical protein